MVLAGNNAGTLEKLAGTGTSNVYFALNDTGGAVSVATGTLALQSGETFTGTTTLGGAGTLNLYGGGAFGGAAALVGTVSLASGTYTLADGSITGGTLGVNGGTAALAAGTPVASTLQLTSGTVSLTGVVTVPNLTMSGGTLTGPGTLSAASQVTWTGGTLSGPLTNAGTITVAGTGYEGLTGTLTNTGTIADTGSGWIYPTANGVTITNQAGAVFDFQGNAWLFYYDPYNSTSYSGLTFNNAGTLEKLAGTGTSNVYFALNDTGGAVSVATGTLALQSGETFTGTTTLGGAGTLNLYGGGAFGGAAALVGTVSLASGTYTLADGSITGGTLGVNGGTAALAAGTPVASTLQLTSGTVSLTGVVTVPNLTMSGGTLTGPGTLSAASQVTWTGGTLSGPLTNAGTITVAGTGYEGLTGTLTNTGTIADTGSGWIYPTANGVTITNQAGAVFDFQGNAWLFYYDPYNSTSYSGLTFNNAGTLEKSAGTGTTTIDFTLNDTAGTVNALSGTLDLPNSGLVSSGTLGVGTWVVGSSSTLTISGVTSITTLSANVTLQGSAATFTGLSSLAKIYSTGVLALQNGVSFTSSGNLDNAGTVDLAPGTLNVNGNYTQESTGAIDLAVGGLNAGSQFGQVNVTNQASLNGTLALSLINGYSPQLGNSYRILKFGSRTGDFTVETGLYLGGGEGFSPTYDSSGLNLVAIPEEEEAGTTTTVASSLSPSTYGQAVTFTATVAPTLSTSLVPTGTVTFYDGSATLGTATLSGGTASFTTSILITGSHSIIAQYGGDSNFSGSNSTPLAQTVNQDGSGTVVASSLNPSTYGQSVTFTATVTAAAPGSGTPTGTVTFYDGSTTLGSATLSNGTAILTTSVLATGTDSITASYGGDTNFTGSTATAITQTVSQDGSATTLSSSSVNPSVYGQAVMFTATVTATAPGSGTPTGTVTFYDGSTALDTATLSGGSAAFATSALALGSHPITVVYGGDTNFTGSTSPVFTQVVNEYASTTAVSSSVEPSVYGQSVTFTATVSATAPGEGTPTGNVTLYDGSTALDTEVLSGGSATFTTSSLAVGTHSITAVYDGDSSFNGSTSTALSQVVNPDGSATVVTSSVNPSVFTQAVTFTATVTATAPGTGTPTGQVIFYDGTTAIDTETLNGGSASYTTSALSVNSHSITVKYSGDTNFAGSTSAAFTQTINQDGSTTVVSSSANPAVVGQSVTLTATVSAISPGSGTPTGTVTFYDGTTAIDTETLAGGTATFTTSSLALGNHSISAGYGGDTDFTTSTSATITVSITPVPPPAAGTQSVTVGEGLSRAITFSSSDPNGDPLAFTVTTPPTAGQLTGSGANVTYTPGSGFSGNDSFQFTVTDTTTGLTSVGVVSITVVPPPTASNQSVTTTENSAQSITLTSTDPNADPLTYTVTSPPADGRLSGSGANLIYTPTSGYFGGDSFLFTATDAATGLVSAAGTVSINVVPVADLVVGMVSAPSSVVLGQPVTVAWTDVNQGATAATGPWVDRIYLYTSPTDTSPVLVASVPFSGTLGADQTTSLSATVNIPANQPGSFYFGVTTDYFHQVNEGNTARQNSTISAQATVISAPDLAAESVTTPATGQFGQPITVTWTVTNQGSAPATGSWDDQLYVSSQPTLNGNAVLLTTQDEGAFAPLAAAQAIRPPHRWSCPSAPTCPPVSTTSSPWSMPTRGWPKLRRATTRPPARQSTSACRRCRRWRFPGLRQERTSSLQGSR